MATKEKTEKMRSEPIQNIELEYRPPEPLRRPVTSPGKNNMSRANKLFSSLSQEDNLCRTLKRGDRTLTKVRKLPGRTGECGPKNVVNRDCTNYNEPKRVTLSAVPRDVRLNTTPKQPFSKLRDDLPLPAVAVPRMSLPEWRVLPLDRKIPGVKAPKGAIVLSRGIVGKRIMMKSKNFSLADPRNLERSIYEYNSLHDPHAVNYLKKPSVQKVLLKNGLINESGEVVCSLKEFNKYRLYLRSVYNDSLEEYIHEQDTRIKYDIETKKKLDYYESQHSQDGIIFLRAEKMKRALANVKAKREAFVARYQNKWERENFLFRCHLEHKIRQKINTQILSSSKRQYTRLRQEALIRDRERRQKQLQIALAAKERAVVERLEMDKKNFLDAYENFVTEWLALKCESQEKRLERDDIVRQCVDATLEEKATKRLQKLDQYRQRLTEITRKHKEDEIRIWKLVRKYFNLWRDKVRQRRLNRPDEKHVSTWDVTESLKKTHYFLMQMSGEYRLHNLFLNVAKLRELLAEEERAEAEEKQRLEEEQKNLDKQKLSQEQAQQQRNITVAQTPETLPPEEPDHENDHKRGSRSSEDSPVKSMSQDFMKYQEMRLRAGRLSVLTMEDSDDVRTEAEAQEIISGGSTKPSKYSSRKSFTRYQSGTSLRTRPRLDKSRMGLARQKYSGRLNKAKSRAPSQKASQKKMKHTSGSFLPPPAPLVPVAPQMAHLAHLRHPSETNASSNSNASEDPQNSGEQPGPSHQSPNHVSIAPPHNVLWPADTHPSHGLPAPAPPPDASQTQTGKTTTAQTSQEASQPQPKEKHKPDLSKPK